MSDDTLREFVADLAIYYQVAKKRHGNAWLCSLRSKMRLDRAEFERLALAAHRDRFIELTRADLTGFEAGFGDAEMDERYLTESALKVPGANYVFHFLTQVF